MLTTPERIIFALAVLITLYVGWKAAERLVLIIARGHGRPDWSLARKRLFAVLGKTISLAPTWRLRPGPTLLHALVAWSFMAYLFVNAGDVYEGYFTGRFLGSGFTGNVYRLTADLLTFAGIAGMVLLLVRRLFLRPETLSARDSTLLHPKARMGMRRDSAIVGLFIIFHLGFRLMGQSFALAIEGPDLWQHIASLLSGAW